MHIIKNNIGGTKYLPIQLLENKDYDSYIFLKKEKAFSLIDHDKESLIKNHGVEAYIKLKEFIDLDRYLNLIDGTTFENLIDILDVDTLLLSSLGSVKRVQMVLTKKPDPTLLVQGLPVLDACKMGTEVRHLLQTYGFYSVGNIPDKIRAYKK